MSTKNKTIKKKPLENFIIRIVQNIHIKTDMIDAQIEQLQNARVELLVSKGFYEMIFETYGFDKNVFKEDMEKT